MNDRGESGYLCLLSDFRKFSINLIECEYDVSGEIINDLQYVELDQLYFQFANQFF